MGKKIDGFILTVFAAAALYLYFYRAFGNHAAALALAAISFLLISRLVRKIISLARRTHWMQRHRMRRRCSGTIMHLACMNAEAAAEKIAQLLEKCYRCESPMEILQLPPACTLPQERVFELWKRHSGEEKLVICCTCGCDAACRALSESLNQPKIALLDANALSQLIAEHPQGIYVEAPPAKRRRMRMQRLGTLLVSRKNAPRSLLFSGVMLLMYLLSGKIYYLLGSMLLLFAGLASLRRVRRPAKLF